MNISLIMGFVLLIVFLISPQMLLWSIGIGIYGVPLGVLAAVLAYVPRYRRWLVSRTGYLYLSLLPGLSTTQQDELRPARLSLLSLGCLVIPSLLWWLFLWRGRTFVRSDGVENAGIYAIVGLIGLALFFRWLNKGWKFNTEFEARTADMAEKSKKWSLLLKLLMPKNRMSRVYLYIMLTVLVLEILRLFGLYVTLIETILVCLPAYRFWLIRRPGYSYYLARLPGFCINAQRTIKPLKLVVATLLYLLIPSLLGIATNQVAEVFIPQNLQDYGILMFACLIAFGLLHLWLVLAWGTEARLLDIRVLGEDTSNTTSSQQWSVIWKTSVRDIFKRVLPYLKALKHPFRLYIKTSGLSFFFYLFRLYFFCPILSKV